jgi:ankyrin repeat protein
VLYSGRDTDERTQDSVNRAGVIDAVKEGDAERLRKLVTAERGSASARDGDGISALTHAVYRNRADMVEILLAHDRRSRRRPSET